MAKYSNYYTSRDWNYMEDGYPETGEDGLEYVEDAEDENDEWEHMYSPVQGNWDPRDFEEDEYVSSGYVNYKVSSRHTRSMMATEDKKHKNRQKIKRKRRENAKAKERERQKYYHYDDNEE